MFRTLIPSLTLAVGIFASAQAPTLAGPNTFTPGTNTFNGPVTVGNWAAYGDSLTAGYEGVTNLGSYPFDLQQLIGVPISNQGVGGTLSTQIAVKAGVPNQNGVYSTIEATSGSLAGCTTTYPACSYIQIGFNLGYEPTANSSTGGGVVPAYGTINGTSTVAPTGTVSTTLMGTTVSGVGTNFTTALFIGSTITVGGESHTVLSITNDSTLTTAAWMNTNAGVSWTALTNVHGTVALAGLYQGTGVTVVSGVSIKLNNLAQVAGAPLATSAINIIEVTGLTGTGCNPNGAQTITAYTSNSLTFGTMSCTAASGNPVVSVYTFTPDPYTQALTVNATTTTYTPDQPCNGCSILAWVGRNNINLSGGLTAVEKSTDAIYALVPPGRTFVVLPVIPENVPSEWPAGGNYANLTNYQSYLNTNYGSNYVNVWHALQNAVCAPATNCTTGAGSNIPLPTDQRDVANDNIPTSLRAITAVGTLVASINNSAMTTSMQIAVTSGALVANQIITLDVGAGTGTTNEAENVSCTTVPAPTGNVYSVSGCTRGYGGGMIYNHSAGAIVNQDDGTHLNAQGYQVVANAIASHLSTLSATSGVLTPLAGANIFGSYGIQTPITIGGNTTGGIQIQFGNTANTGNSVGTIESSGGTAVAFNAVQNGGYATDQWTQPNTSAVSFLETIGANGWGLYHALSGVSNAGFNSFWPAYVAPAGTVSTTASSATVTGVGTNFTMALIVGSSITVGTETHTVQSIASDTSLTTSVTWTNTNAAGTAWTTPPTAHADAIISYNLVQFDSSITKFINNANATNQVLIQAGLTADEIAALEFYDKTGTSKWSVEKDANNALELYSGADGYARFIASPSSITSVNSAGSTSVRINYTANSGTGGLAIWSGGSSSSQVATVNGNGISSFNGSTAIVKVNADTNSGTGGLAVYSGGTTPASVATVDGSGMATFKGISTGTSGSTGKATCWKTSTTIGYCSTQPDATGSCTCN